MGQVGIGSGVEKQRDPVEQSDKTEVCNRTWKLVSSELTTGENSYSPPCVFVGWLVGFLLLFSKRRTLASFSCFIYSLEEEELIK